jgi:hypothetical protein
MVRNSRVRRSGLLAAILLAVAALAISMPATTEAATSAVYSKTVTGTDLHSLNPSVVPMLVPNTGGGIQAYLIESDPEPPSEQRYLEAAVELPVGAKVTSVSLTYADCPGAVGITFGSYSPTQGTFASHASFFTGPAVNCQKTTTSKTGSPIVTVAAGRRYVWDWHNTGLYPYNGTLHEAAPTFYGATVRYTCTAPCVP